MTSEYDKPGTDAALAEFYVQITDVGSDDSLSAAEKSVRIADLTASLQSTLMGEKAVEPTTTDPGSVTVFKDTSGQWRWFAVHSNKYADRTKEIFPESAHKEFVDHVWATKEFPALRLWHIPVDVGRADFIDYDSDGFVVSSGGFKAGMEDVAQRLAGMKGLGCSHGYLYKRGDLQDGVYKAYRSYEISVLPVDRAANTLTAFFADSEVPMLTAARKAFLVDVMGEERADEIERGIGQLKSIAEAQGLSYKSLEEALLDNVRAAADVAAPTEKCPECGDMIPKGDMAAHMQDAHNTGAATKDDAPAADNPAAVADPPAAVVAEAAAVAAAATDTAPTAAPNDEPPPADAETPSAEDVAAAAAALAAVGGAAPTDSDGTKDDSLVGVLRTVFAASIQPLADEVRGLRALTETQQAEIEALKGVRSAEIADMIRPRIGNDARVSVAASASDDNLVDPKVAQALKDALGKKDAPVTPVSGYLDDMFGALSAARGGLATVGAPR